VAHEIPWFVQKDLDILGSRNALPEDFDAVIGMREQRRFPVEDAVRQLISPAEAPEALRFWSDEPSRVKKIMAWLDRGWSVGPTLL
jgi:threonine dehydrogenase-like Zn-dependent dehydrogenase